MNNILGYIFFSVVVIDFEKVELIVSFFIGCDIYYIFILGVGYIYYFRYGFMECNKELNFVIIL